MKQHRYLRLAGATGTMRIAQFHKRDHLVVPVTMMVEGVVWAVNSTQPELALASEFLQSFKGWNGRPVVGDHPDDGTQKISANDPQVLERCSFGHLFNAADGGDRLLAEAWLDEDRAKEVGHDAVRVCERARAGEPIEVSVGVFLTLEEREGTYKGKKYFGIWRAPVPDHLAMLPEGMTGACSVEMGCGTPTAASTYLVTSSGLITLASVAEKPMMKCVKCGVELVDGAACTKCVEDTPTRSLRERLSDLLSFRSSKGTQPGKTDDETRSALSKALRSIEPAFLGVETVFPDDGEVIFAAAPGEKFQLFRRDYSIKSDGSVKFGEVRNEVIPTTSFVDASATGDKPPTTSCGCHKKPGEENMDKAARIKALIDSSNGRYTTADTKWLEAVPEDRLTALESADKVVAKVTADEVAAAAAKKEKDDAEKARLLAGASAETAEQFISRAPAELQESLREGLRANATKREGLIKALKETKRCTFKDEDLAAMSTEGLVRLSTLAAVPPPIDYSLSGGVQRDNSAGEEVVPEPGDLIASVRTAAGFKS